MTTLLKFYLVACKSIASREVAQILFPIVISVSNESIILISGDYENST